MTHLVIKGAVALLVLRILYSFIAPLFSPLRKIPGPFAGHFSKLWYEWRMYRADFHYHNIELHRKHGPLVMLAPGFISFDDPDAIKKVYGIASKFPKSDWYQAARKPGKDVFTLFSDQNMKRHAETRKLFANMYSMSSVVAYEPLVDQCTKLFVEKLDEIVDKGEPVNMARWFQVYAFDVIACISFGKRFGFLDRGEDINNMMGSLRDGVKYGVLVALWPWLHALVFYPAAKLGFGGAKGRMDHIKFVQERMAQREEERRSRDLEKAGSGKPRPDGRPDDFMDRLWDKHDENPDKMTKMHVLINGVSNITAGSDTLSTTLSGILFFLLANPRTLTKLKEEINERYESGQLSEQPTFKECQPMTYLDAVLKESLRLHSAVGIPLWRDVPEGGVEIAGQFIPEGTTVGVNAWVAHRNQDVWGSDANEFRPERWLEAEAEAQAGNKARLQRMEAYYLPFGLGARTCIGRHIGMLEILKLLPVLLRRFDFELAMPKEDMEWENAWFVLPKNLNVRVRRSKAF